jgi:multidrug transporter EmrE-like cation transporter
MKFVEILVLLGAVLSGSIGQFFLKSGTTKLGAVTASNVLGHIVSIVLVPQLVIGLVFYAVGAILYILLMTRVPLSVLGPAVAMQYVVTVLMGHFLFNEMVPLSRAVGLGFVMCGVVLIIWKH